MIIKPEMLKKIRSHFNLNIYEGKVWIALLNKGVATASEVAELSSVPRSRTYDVLESLEKKGFAIEKLGKPVKFIAVKPLVVLDRLKTSLISEAEEKADVLVELKDTEDFKQIELLYKQGIQPVNTEELSGTIKGKTSIYSHLKDMIGGATDNIIMATNTSALRKKAKFINPLLENLKKKGIKMKIVVNGTDEEISQLTKEVKADIKKTDINARFCVVDSKQILFMLKPNAVNGDDTGIWVNSNLFATALNSLFNTAWGK